MARIRTVKPEAWRDARLGRASLDAQLLWVKLLGLADDAGRFPADPGSILGHGYPLTIVQHAPHVEEWLQELADAGLIVLYQHGQEAYGVFPRFREHQVVNRPSRSRLPEPPTHVACWRYTNPDDTHGALSEGSVSPHALGTNFPPDTVLRESSLSAHGATETPVNTGLTEPSVSPHGTEVGSRNREQRERERAGAHPGPHLTAVLHERAAVLDDRDRNSQRWAAAWPLEKSEVFAAIAELDDPDLQRRIIERLRDEARQWAARSIRHWVVEEMIPRERLSLEDLRRREQRGSSGKPATPQDARRARSAQRAAAAEQLAGSDLLKSTGDAA